MPLEKQHLVDAAQWMLLPQDHLPDALRLADLDSSGAVDTPKEFARLYEMMVTPDEFETVAQGMRQKTVATSESLEGRSLTQVTQLQPALQGLGQIVRTRGVSAGSLAIQQALEEISAKLSDYPNCDVGTADGMFGAMTENAVKAFQSAHPSLETTGAVDESTLKKLDEILDRARSLKVNDIAAIEATVEPQRPRMITYGDRFGHECVLTFDDGPVPNTTHVLDALKQENITGATFFVQGINARRYPDILRRILAEGHVIGNHSYDHPDLRKLSAQEIRDQLHRCQEAVNAALGEDYPMTQMRPPYGALNDTTETVIAQEQLSVLLWQVDSNDWRPENKRHLPNIVANVCTGTYSVKGGRGGVILMHDIHRTTATVLSDVIHQLKAQGLTFTTAEALIRKKYPA